jgi:hypothetical protein
VQTVTFGIRNLGTSDSKHLKQTFNTALTELTGGTLSERARRARTPIVQRNRRVLGAPVLDPQKRALADAATALAALWQTKG